MRVRLKERSKAPQTPKLCPAGIYTGFTLKSASEIKGLQALPPAHSLHSRPGKPSHPGLLRRYRPSPAKAASARDGGTPFGRFPLPPVLVPRPGKPSDFPLPTSHFPLPTSKAGVCKTRKLSPPSAAPPPTFTSSKERNYTTHQSIPKTKSELPGSRWLAISSLSPSARLLPRFVGISRVKLPPSARPRTSAG